MIDDYEQVYQHLQTALGLEINPNAEYMDSLLIEYGNAMINTGRYELAMNMEMLQNSLSEYSDYYLLMGKIYYLNNFPLKALGALLKATTAPKIICYGTNTYFPLHIMGIIYEQLGQQEMAENCRKQAEKLALQVLDDEGWKNKNKNTPTD